MAGRLTVISGPMASGKTGTLIWIIKERLRMNPEAKIILFKNKVDTRDQDGVSRSRNGSSYPSIAVSSYSDMMRQIMFSYGIDPQLDLICIEEAQFFSSDLFEFIDLFLKVGTDVVVTGLAQDYAGEPFGIMGDLLCIADNVEFIPARCSICGGMAARNQRLIDGKPSPITEQVVIDNTTENVTYEPRCRGHWVSPYVV